jgi:hypothetical protein
MASRAAAFLPKFLIIPPRISHFTAQILHSYPESLPKYLIGVPKSFTITQTTL